MPFDAARLRLTGPQVAIAQHVERDAVTMAFFSASDDGILIYAGARITKSQLIWFDRTGKELERATLIGNYSDPLLSHDNKSVLLDIPDEKGMSDIWRFDLTRRISTRLTFGSGDNFAPIWSPDDKRIVFTSNRRSSFDLFMKNANGSGTEELLNASMYYKYANTWSSDGRFISYSSFSPPTKYDIFALSLPDRKTIPIAQGPFDEEDGRFSPDDRWVAYTSDETGRDEIYVQPFPPDGRRWQITTEGGHRPTWSADGKELFFMTDRKLMSIGVKTRVMSEAGTTKWVFEPDVAAKPLFKLASWSYCPSSDGQRFLVNVPTETEKIAPVTLVENWPALFKR
jgi:Tol biopolymer transport system component